MHARLVTVGPQPLNAKTAVAAMALRKNTGYAETIVS
jgi:hypothetical protein